MTVKIFDGRQFLNGRTMYSTFVAILFLALSAYASVSKAVSASCKAIYSGSATQALAPLRQALGSNFSDFPKRSIWVSYPLQESITQKLVNSLLLLNTAERAQAVYELKQAPPKDERLLKSLLLALYDLPTWETFFKQFTQQPLLNDSLVNSLVPVLRHMPTELRDHFYNKIRPIYTSLSKKNFTWFPFRRELRLAPKRSVDAFVQHTMHADEMILHDFQESGDPLKAFQNYLDFSKQKLFVDSNKGAYQAEDVLTVGRSIQAVLRSKESELTDPYIIVTGSFPNGHADLNFADLDLQLSSRDLTKLFPEMNANINKALAVKFPQVRLYLEAMRAQTTPHFAAQINPVFLKISLTKIELLIYPAFSPLNRDQVLMPFNYEDPRTLTLEENQITRKVQRLRGNQDHERPELSVWVANGYLGIPAPSRWLENPYSEPETQALVEQSLQLTEKERLELLQKMQRAPPKDKNVEKIFRLSLFDEKAWLDYFADFSNKPQANDALFNALVPIFSKMPQTLRSVLLEKAHEAYPKAKRIKFVRRFPTFKKRFYQLAPKRSLDVLISNLLALQDDFRKKIKNGESVLQAYENVLRFQKQSVFSGYPQGEYTALDILKAAQAIKSVMHRHENVDTGWSITMGGSFPSGRARLETSDIDIMLSNSKYNEYLEEMTTEVNEALRKTNPESGLEVHSFFETTTEVNAAIVSPIFVRISADKIELMVYPPIRSRERDAYQLSRNYNAPDVYLLDTNE